MLIKLGHITNCKMHHHFKELKYKLRMNELQYWFLLLLPDFQTHYGWHQTQGTLSWTDTMHREDFNKPKWVLHKAISMSCLVFCLSWSNCYKLHKLPPTNILVQNSLGSLESISFLKFYLHPSHLHEETCGCDGYVCSLAVVMAQWVYQNLSDCTL